MKKNLEKQIKKREEQLTKERNERCEPVATRILQIIAEHNPSPEDIKDNDRKLEVFAPIQKAIAQEMHDSGLTISDVKYTFSIVQSLFDYTRDLTITSIQEVFESAQRKLFKIDDLYNLTLEQLHGIMVAEPTTEE